MLDNILANFHQIDSEPLTVAVLGQTGVGKTSLINALFNTNLPTGDISPVTKRPESVSIKDQRGHDLLIFWDMPGIGESYEADAQYLDYYRDKVLSSDIALWALHSDSRSVTFDIDTLRKMLEPLGQSDKRKLISKLAFVMTKADLVNCGPWILGKRKERVTFAINAETQALLEDKANYFRNALIIPFGADYEARTFHSGKFSVSESIMDFDGKFVSYHGFMQENDLHKLKSKYPKYSDVFERLYDNTKVVYCSTRFRFNLIELMSSIVHRVKGKSAIRFRKFIEKDISNSLTWDVARNFSNFLVYDLDKDEVVYDLRQLS